MSSAEAQVNSNQPEERDQQTPEDTSKIYFTDNSTLQTPEEEKLDKETHRTNHTDAQDSVIETNTVLEDTRGDEEAGTDRGGTNERKS